MKKKFSMLLSIVIAAASISIPVTTTAQDNEQSINIVVSGSAIECDQPPVIVEGRTLIPLRAVAEAVGAEVNWDDAEKAIYINTASSELRLEIGADEMEIKTDGKAETIPVEVPAQIINERTMVPVRFVAEALGLNVEWQEENKTVIISSKTAEASEALTEYDSQIQEDTAETTTETQTKVIKAKDSDYTLKAVKNPTVDDSIEVNGTTIFTVNAVYIPVEGNDAYTQFAKSRTEKDVADLMNDLGANLERKCKALSADEIPNFEKTSVKYTYEVTYCDDKAVSAIITTDYYKNSLMYNSKRTVMVTDATGKNNLTIEELTEDKITADEIYDAAIDKFNALFEADKMHLYLDKVKNGGLTASMLKFHIDNNGNYIFSADRGIVAPSKAGVISVMFTPKEIKNMAN